MEQNEFELNLYERIAPLKLDDETKKQVIDIVFWAMEEVAEMRLKTVCAPNGGVKGRTVD